MNMNVERLTVNTNAVIPLMAALPYSIEMDDPHEASSRYDPEVQLTYYAGCDFSTCREDESVQRGFFTSKTDTNKDD
jgi:tRNA(Leu) C34 or U34 (ribose-2'-O)-methylase TrmL